MKMLNIISAYIQILSITLSYILTFISALESELLNSIFFLFMLSIHFIKLCILPFHLRIV